MDRSHPDHPRPWRIEEDWTAEIVDANGKIIMKAEYPRGLWLAQLIVNAVNAYAAYDANRSSQT